MLACISFSLNWCFQLTITKIFRPRFKIDKDGANQDRVMQELSSIGLMPEDWGGQTPMVKVPKLQPEICPDISK